jgi:hypothetical protein
MAVGVIQMGDADECGEVLLAWREAVAFIP